MSVHEYEQPQRLRMYYSQRAAVGRCARALGYHMNLAGHSEQADLALAWMRALLSEDRGRWRRLRWERAEVAFLACERRLADAEDRELRAPLVDPFVAHVRAPLLDLADATWTPVKGYGEGWSE